MKQRSAAGQHFKLLGHQLECTCVSGEGWYILGVCSEKTKSVGRRER